MEPQFLTFRRFNEPALAQALIDLLNENNIEYEVGEESLVANPLMVAGDELMREYLIKIKQADFDKVNNLLVAAEETALQDVEADYYLFDFTDQELVDVIKNFDEWSAFDFALARKILKDRGVVIDDNHIADFKQDKIDMLKQPEKDQNFWIVTGYFCIFLSGLPGMFIGWFLYTYKKTLPNGERVFAYSEHDRRHGKRILLWSTVAMIIAVTARFYTALHL